MFILIRAITYAALIVGLVLVFLSGGTGSWSGITRPATLQLPQVAGMVMGVAGAALALWCVVTFAFVGRGTPLPFDPPRRLVVGGPYRFVRNPMAIGVTLVLSGVGLLYRWGGVLSFAVLFVLVIHAFVVWYEEPTLRRMFGDEYESYQRRVRRWWPRVRTDRDGVPRSAAPTDNKRAR